MKVRLAAHEAGVEAARDGGVGSPFNDGAAVGKQGKFVGFAPEFQHEIIVTHRAMRTQALGHLREINGTVALVNLHGISAAKSEVWAAFTGQVNEFATSTGAAVWPGGIG